LSFPLFCAATLSSTRTVVVPTAMTRRPELLASFTTWTVSALKLESFLVHFVRGQRFGFHRRKRAGSDVQRDKTDLHAARANFIQQRLREMQTGGRCRDRTVGAGENSLITLLVFNHFVRMGAGM
jgi:hypothetical protein